MKPHRFHPEAVVEYVEAARYYAERGEDLGGRFYDEIERVIAEIRTALNASVSTIHQLSAIYRAISPSRSFISMSGITSGS